MASNKEDDTFDKWEKELPVLDRDAESIAFIQSMFDHHKEIRIVTKLDKHDGKS